MSISYKSILFAWMLLVLWPLIGESSRQTDACTQDQTCQRASNDYTVPYCVTNDVDYAQKCNFSSLTNTLSSKLISSNFTFRDMISQYCKSMQWNQNIWRIYYAKPNILTDSRDWRQTFDSRQSLFVYSLCSSLLGENGPIDFSIWLKWNIVQVLKLQQKLNWQDKCNIKDSPSLDDCDMSLYATEIFSALMSDMFKIKYAQVFHIDSAESFQSEKNKRVLTFLSWYFDMNDDKYLTKFPETVDVIDSNQQYYKTVLESLKLLNNSVFAKNAEESKCPITWNMVWMDFVACALHSSQWKWTSLDLPFQTLFYNEIINYRIFVSYYSNWVQAKINNSSVKEEKDMLQSRVTDFQGYSNLQIEAAEETLRKFEEFNMSYPLHIGLLLYQEKVKEFRNKHLSPITTKFYSLSEKLQNVQLPK